MAGREIGHDLRHHVPLAVKQGMGFVLESPTWRLLRPRRLKKWRTFNETLLLRLFTTDEYQGEYSQCIVIHDVADRYGHPSFSTFRDRLTRSLNKQVAVLESIIDRLELVEDAPEEWQPYASCWIAATGRSLLSFGKALSPLKKVLFTAPRKGGRRAGWPVYCWARAASTSTPARWPLPDRLRP